MVIGLYNYPLPNNGDRYDLSKEELDALLFKAYRQGFAHAREAYDPTMHQVTTTSAIEDRDDATKWKEVWIK